jgi:hypothetical protein
VGRRGEKGIVRWLLGGRHGFTSRALESVIRRADARSVRNVWPDGPGWWNATTRALAHRYRSIDAWSPSYLRNLAAERRFVGPRLGENARPIVGETLSVRVRTLDQKLATYALLDLLDVPHPKVHGVWPDARDVDLASLPDRFCLKPSLGSTSHGVLLLERTGPDTYVEAMRGTTMTPGDIVAFLREEADGLYVGREVFAEELIDAPTPGAVPFDWKAYCFYGEVGCVLQMSRTPGERPRLKFYGPRGTVLGKVRDPERCDLSLPASPDLPEMVRMARRISSALPMAFIRVDMFDGPSGPLVGELTPTPGGPQMFVRSLDVSMGLMWEAAEKRLIDDLLHQRPFPEFMKVTD